MALNAAIVIEVRNGGSDTNGGGFKTGATGTDWTLQDAAQYSVTDGVTAGTTSLVSATANFGTDVVGNLIYVQGGTGSVTAGWYEITSRTNATTIVVDRSTGLSAGTGTTFKIGGALASPGQAAAIATVAGHTVFIKYNASPYIATSASTNIAAGCVSGTSSTMYCGYDSTRSLYNLDTNRPTFQINSGVSTATLFGNLNAFYGVQSLILDGNSQTTSKCFNSSGECFYVKAMNAASCGFLENSATGMTILCEATGCTVSPFAVSTILFCIAHDNTMGAGTAAFAPPAGGTCYGSVAYTNSRSGFQATGAGNGSFVNCVAFGNTEYGFDVGNLAMFKFINCIAEGNTLNGWRANTGNFSLINCADYNNSSRSTAGTGKIWRDLNPLTGASTFFTDTTNKDFRLNSSAGAALKSVGFPAAFPSPANLTVNYVDISAVRHIDPSGGSVGIIGQ